MVGANVVVLQQRGGFDAEARVEHVHRILVVLHAHVPAAETVALAEH